MTVYHYCISRASTEPGTRYALKQLQLVKEMASVQLELTQAEGLNPTLKPQRGHSPGNKVSEKQDGR